MGTPADVLPLPDGSLLISDDYAGAIYRVTYAAP
jgi:glucose/arabinose dehydrogenase